MCTVSFYFLTKMNKHVLPPTSTQRIPPINCSFMYNCKIHFDYVFFHVHKTSMINKCNKAEIPQLKYTSRPHVTHPKYGPEGSVIWKVHFNT